MNKLCRLQPTAQHGEALVAADVLDGEEFTVQVDQRDAGSFDLYQLYFTIGQLVFFCDIDPIRHKQDDIDSVIPAKAGIQI